MAKKRTIVLTFALFFVFMLIYQGCSKKADDIDDIRETPITTTGAPDGITEISEDASWSEGDWGVVDVLDINFRTEPSAEAPRVPGYPVMYYGTLLEVIGVQGDWINVRFASGVTGWVVTQYEGEEYIKKAELGDLNSASSGTFIKMHRSQIEGFAYDYEIYKYYGTYASLEGTSGVWEALYVADSRTGDLFIVDATGDAVRDINSGDGLPIQLAPYNGPKKPVSSEKVCEYKNIAAFFASERVAANRSKIKQGIADGSIRIDMALSGTTWRIYFVEDSNLAGITGHFDATTGEFLFAEGKMSWE